MRQPGFVVGVDVGTGSARAGIFAADGELLGRGQRPIRLWRPRPDEAEHSSEDIWNSVVAAVRDAARDAAVDPADARGIGLDATCSLVAIDADGEPVAINREGDDARNVIVWMDHRAARDADDINRLGHAVLGYVGGSISPEMQTPKLRWLHRELPDQWVRVAHWFDLPDFLTWRATGSTSRSLCSAVCKWTYLGHEARWDPSYFDRIGLGVLAHSGFSAIGTDIEPPGAAIGRGLTQGAAEELGLPAGTPVATSIIDAHAGALGVLGAASDTPLERRLAIIAGTSACHLAASREPRPTHGVWGPYWSALLSGYWLAEAGLSASGSAIDHVVASHPAADRLDAQPLTELDERLVELSAEAPSQLARLAADIHVDPNLLGNRSPLADPTRSGALVGWSLRDDIDDLAVRYLATVQGLAYATRHIVDTMHGSGWSFDAVTVTGGSTHSELWLQTHADVLGVPVVVPAETDAVLLGAALLGAVAGRLHADVPTAMDAMTRFGRIITPNPDVREFHRAKYGVYRRMLDDQDGYRATMAAVAAI